MRSKNVSYLPAVDHLRLLAALMVVMFHSVISTVIPASAPNSPWPHVHDWPALLITEGQSGVSLFMVISGFVLTYGALGRRLSYGRFLRNRALRLLPLLTVLVLLTAVTTPTLVLPQSALGVLIPSHTTLPGGWLVVAWSVVVEMQLYLVFPLLLHRLDSRGPRGMMPILLLTTGLRFAAMSAGGEPFSVLYLSVFARADQFVLGMLAAWAFRRSPSRLWAPLAPAGLALVFALLAGFDSRAGELSAAGTALGMHWAVLTPTIEGLGWAAVVLGYVAIMRGARGAITRGIAALGETTYSVYLLHMTVVTAVQNNHVHLDLGSTPFLRATATAGLVVVPATLVLARLGYNIIEVPFLRMRSRYVEDPQPIAKREPDPLLRVPLAS